MSAAKCPNGHDKNTVGVGPGGCMECKREAARRYRQKRKDGVPLQDNKRQARTDLGYQEVADS